MPWVKTVYQANWPEGPFGTRKWSISEAHSLGGVLPSSPLPTKKMLAPFNVHEISSARNAALLLLSSQLRPRSSSPSFHRPAAYSTAAMVSLELMATVLPSCSSSLPPKAHITG